MLAVGDTNPMNPDEIVVFVAECDVPTEYTFNGRTFIVDGGCIICERKPINP